MNTKRFYYVLIFFLIRIAVNAQNLTTPDSDMVLVPAGEYIMGKDSEGELDFSPAHKVILKSFYIDKHEVTNGDYLNFCTETGHRLPEFWNSSIFRSGENYLNYPVIGINWGDAKKYAEWAGKRLPTEAEWEYAARGGLVNMEYPNGNSWNQKKAMQDSTAWKNLIDPVQEYEPNGYGLYDMGGNVWEWISDIYSEVYYKGSEINNPTGPTNGTNRVIRGGSWHSGAMCKKVYFRKGLPANWCDFAVGFRCVKDLVLESGEKDNK